MQTKLLKSKQQEISTIYMSNVKLRGFIFFTSGDIRTDDSIIKICKEDNPIDHEIVTKWINTLK